MKTLFSLLILIYLVSCGINQKYPSEESTSSQSSGPPSNPEDCSNVEINDLISFYLDIDGDGLGDFNQSSKFCESSDTSGYVNNFADLDNNDGPLGDLDGDGVINSDDPDFILHPGFIGAFTFDGVDDYLSLDAGVLAQHIMISNESHFLVSMMVNTTNTVDNSLWSLLHFENRGIGLIVNQLDMVQNFNELTLFFAVNSNNKSFTFAPSVDVWNNRLKDGVHKVSLMWIGKTSDNVSSFKVMGFNWYWAGDYGYIDDNGDVIEGGEIRIYRSKKSPEDNRKYLIYKPYDDLWHKTSMQDWSEEGNGIDYSLLTNITIEDSVSASVSPNIPSGVTRKRNSLIAFIDGAYMGQLNDKKTLTSEDEALRIGARSINLSQYTEIESLSEYVITDTLAIDGIQGLHSAMGLIDLRSWALDNNKDIYLYYPMQEDPTVGEVLDYSENQENLEAWNF